MDRDCDRGSPGAVFGTIILASMIGPNPAQPERPSRILVVVPNWVGDVVLATPVLAALRNDFPAARIGFLMRPYVAEIVDGGGWHDEAFFWPVRRGLGGIAETRRLVRKLREARFELALLLTNSFRSALVVWQAGIQRRVGYAREGRGWLLTDRLIPLKRLGEFVPTPMLGYYSAIAERAGCRVTDRRLRLGITTEQEAAADALKRHYGLNGAQRYAVINPGAAFGAAKCWLPERFAEVCDRVQEQLGWRAVVVGAPGEAPLMRRIAELARTPVVCCDAPGTTLGSLKPLVRDAALLVCNDTGPRHYGNAFGVPTVTIFGPTHREWTDTDYAGEIKLQRQVECGPCQLRTCPLDHRCMTAISVDDVVNAAKGLRSRGRC
jgi:heptosyltransferase-2